MPLSKECMLVVLQLIRLLLVRETRQEKPCIGEELGLEFEVLLEFRVVKSIIIEFESLVVREPMIKGYNKKGA